MKPGFDHEAAVDAWMGRARELESEELLRTFARAFSRLWGRAHVTLGDVTLTAIADRVMHNATDKFPLLASVRLDGRGLDLGELGRQVASIHEEELAKALRFVLIEFLSVLGSFTAEILTPALHAELGKTAPKKGPRVLRGRKLGRTK